MRDSPNVKVVKQCYVVSMCIFPKRDRTFSVHGKGSIMDGRQQLPRSNMPQPCPIPTSFYNIQLETRGTTSPPYMTSNRHVFNPAGGPS